MDFLQRGKSQLHRRTTAGPRAAHHIPKFALGVQLSLEGGELPAKSKLSESWRASVPVQGSSSILPTRPGNSARSKLGDQLAMRPLKSDMLRLQLCRSMISRQAIMLSKAIVPRSA